MSMANLLLLLLFGYSASLVVVNAAPCLNCSEYHCPQGDTNCYFVQASDTPCSGLYSALSRQLLSYMQRSPALRLPLSGSGPIVVAVSPARVSARSVCWGSLRNATVSAGFADLASPSEGDRLKVATVRASNVSGVSVSLVDPTVTVRPPLCEAPLTSRSNLSARTDTFTYICYDLLGTCYFAQRAPVTWQDAQTGCQFSGKLALAKDSTEEFLLRSFVKTLNTSIEYYLQAQECSPEYVMSNSSETLSDFLEPKNFSSPEQFRVTRFPACARLDSNGGLTMGQNCSVDKWLCYQKIPMTVNSSMCIGSYCHAFWNFGLGSNGTQRTTALERCPAALPRLDDILELRSEAALIPIGNPSTAMTYHTGIRKLPISQRKFFLNVNSTNSTPLEVTVNNGDASSTMNQHCLQMRLNSTNTFGAFVAHCSDSNATVLYCQYPNGSLAAVDPGAVYLTFFEARTRCRNLCGGGKCHLPNSFSSNQSSSGGADSGGGGTETRSSGIRLVDVAVDTLRISGTGSTSSSGISSFWLDGYEYQNWTDSVGGPLYDFYLSPASPQASDEVMDKLIYRSGTYSTEECLYLTVVGGSAANISLSVSACSTAASVTCRSGPLCSQPPSYADGYPSGSGWYNLSAGSLVVDLMSGNCSVFDVTSLGIETTTYYGCNAPVPGSLSNFLPVVFSTCSMGAGSLDWSQLANTSACRGGRCDLRSLFSMADVDNQRYLRLTRSNDSAPLLGSPDWLVANRTRVDVACLPGAAIEVANASFGFQQAVSTDLYCSSDTWVFNTSYFW